MREQLGNKTKLLRIGAICSLICLLLNPAPVDAQATGFAEAFSVSIMEESGSALTDYEQMITFDSAALIGAGKLRADGADIRVSSDANGTMPLVFFVDATTINTASTVLWVQIPSLAANATMKIWVSHGNPSASSQSSIATFKTPVPAFGQPAATNSNGNGNSQQLGQRFTVNKPIVVTALGKREPNGDTHTVTLFNVATQAIVAQHSVEGPEPGAWTYSNLSDPVFLDAGETYTLQIFRAPGTAYYWASPAGSLLQNVNPAISYVRADFCDNCTANTFPTSSAANFVYGVPEMEIRVLADRVSPEPMIALSPCSQSASTDADCSAPLCGDGIQNSAAGETCDDGNTSSGDDCNPLCQPTSNESIGSGCSAYRADSPFDKHHRYGVYATLAICLALARICRASRRSRWSSL